jgi:DNA-binding SARP family transcriptional activator
MIRLRTLGTCAIEIGNHRLTPESDVLFALLLYVASNTGRELPRTDLTQLLWPDCGTQSASHRLRQALYQLRKLGAPIQTTASSVEIRRADVDPDYCNLASQLEDLWRSPENIRLDLFPGYAPALSVPFARWLEAQRDTVRTSLRRQLRSLLDQHQARGDHAAVVKLAELYREIDPFDRRATLELAQGRAMLGDRRGALAVLDQYRAELSATNTHERPSLGELRRRICEADRVDARETLTSTLIGRDALIADLAEWVTGMPYQLPILALFGEPGIGKTRLLNEGVKLLTLRGANSVTYTPSANGEGRPLAGIVDLLPKLLSLPGAVGCTPESYSRLSALARGVSPERDFPDDVTDSAFRYATLRRSVFDLLDAILSESELAIAIDDAHRLDRLTLEIIVDASRANPKLSLLTAVRPIGGTAEFLAGQPDIRLIRIPRLDQDSSRQVIERHLAPEIVRERSKLIEWAVDLAGGNPFFLVELASHCGDDNPRESVPKSLQRALQRKLDALSHSARLLVQACAVLGQNATFSRLDAMLALPAHATASALAELDAWGLVSVRGERIACQHDLIAEEVVGSLGVALGRYLHRQAAVVLDTEIASAPAANLAWECAIHWEAAGEDERALGVTIGIADQLLTLGLPHAAIDLCVRAERYCKTATHHADLLLPISRARRALHDWDGTIAALERRAKLQPTPVRSTTEFSDDEIALFEARWWRNPDERVLQPVLERVADAKAPVSHRLQMAVLGLIVADSYQRRREARLLAKQIETVSATTARDELEKDRARVVYHASFGSIALAVEAAHRLVIAERSNGTSAAMIRALRWSSIPLKYANKLVQSYAALEEAFRVAERLGLHSQMYHAALGIVDNALDVEDVATADKWMPTFLELVPAPSVDPAQTAIAAVVRARHAWARSDIEECGSVLRVLRTLGDAGLRGRVGVEETAVALDVAVQISAGEGPIRPGFTEKLERFHFRTRWSGTRDFETGTLVLGLVRQARLARARSIYGRYLRECRRSCLPLHSVLESAAVALSRC